MMLKKSQQIRNRLVTVLADTLDEAIASEIAFHLTDWKEDLELLVQIYEKEESLSDEQISKIIYTFLAHVPNHLAAAKKLIGLGPIEDVFNVGIAEEDE
jgi:hypothetical protein